MHLIMSVTKERIASWVRQQVKEYETVPRKPLSLGNLLFVSGNSGVGKTYTIHKICEELDLHMIYITSSNCNSSTELNDLLIKSCTSSLIQVLSNDTRPKIIVIDEFESLMSLDRTINITLLNILTASKYKMVPIVCIASNEIIKKIGNIKKKCQIIEINDPTVDELYNILFQLYPNKDPTILQQIASTSSANIAQAVENARGYNVYDDIDEKHTIQFLYGDSFDRDTIRKLVLSDPWMVPLTYHENLIAELGRRKTTIAKSKELYTKFIIDMLTFDKLMHNDSNILASDIFTSIVYPLTKLPLKKNAISNIEGFTKILSYLSLQKKYTKKIFTNSDYPLYQIGSYHTNIMNGRNYIFLN